MEAPSARADGLSEHGLKKDAVGFWSGLAIALDSTAPAYSLAAVIGIIIVGVGLQAPAVLLVAFVPMFLTSLAFANLNRVEPDCGTSFAWVRRAMGPFMGWVTGFVVTVTGVLVIGSLAEVAASYTYLLFDWEAAAGVGGDRHGGGDRRDDHDLRHRHRAVGRGADGAGDPAGRRAAAVRGRGPGLATAPRPLAVVAEPVRDRLVRAR